MPLTCAVVEKLIECETAMPNTHLGGGDTSNNKRQKLHYKGLTEGETPKITPDKVQPTILKDKWKIGAGLTEQEVYSGYCQRTMIALHTPLND